MAIISDLLRIIAKPIILKLGKGLKSSKTKYCLGDEIDIRLDESITGKDNVIAKPPTTINSFARWIDGDSKQITDSKTIQDDDGTTETTSTVDGELKQLIENLSSNNSAAVVQHLRSLVKTMIRQEIKNKQIWDTYIDATSKSYIIRGQNLENSNQTGTILQLFRNGIFTAINQPKASAQLTQKTPNFPVNKWFTIGSNLAFKKLRDEDGFNKSTAHLRGGGDSEGLHYLISYQGIWDVGYQFVIDLTYNDIQALVEFRICWGKSPNYQRLKSQFYITNEYYRTIEGSKRLTLEVGDRVFFQVRVNKGNPYFNTFASAQDNEIDNYVGFLYLGF